MNQFYKWIYETRRRFWIKVENTRVEVWDGFRKSKPLRPGNFPKIWSYLSPDLVLLYRKSRNFECSNASPSVAAVVEFQLLSV